MEAVKARAPSKLTGNNDPNAPPATSTTKSNHAFNDSAGTSSTDISITKSSDGGANVSEDVLLFGARSSHLFDDIAIAIDSLLTEEVATLPLLPRKLTEQELRQHQQQQDGNGGSSSDNDKKPPQTGEQKLIAHLRKAYKKNIDAAEAYSNRNIFTVQNHSKTKRRQILEQYFNTGKGDADSNAGNPNAGDSTSSFHSTAAVTTTTSFAPLPDDMELPSPDTIMNMDKEILETRQRIQHAKQRRIQLTRQLGRLQQANQLLVGVLEALQMIDKLDANATTTTGKSTKNNEDIASLMQSLKKSVLNAMEGHEELKVWNNRAEEVLQLLDKIKVDRDETRGGGAKNHLSRGNDGGTKVVAEREEDERRRRNTLQEMGDSLGSKEQVASLLNKLRGN